MALHILDEHPNLLNIINGCIAKVGDKWAFCGPFMGHWIGGFESEADALLVADAMETAIHDARDTDYDSYRD